jgi:hypothetical protein
MATATEGHDYVTHGGGAERVALLIAREIADAKLSTLVCEAGRTHPHFGNLAICRSETRQVSSSAGRLVARLREMSYSAQ